MNVYVVCHKCVESGAEDTFEIINIFKDKQAAEAIAYNCNSEIDQNENEECGIEEEYWVEAHKVQ